MKTISKLAFFVLVCVAAVAAMTWAGAIIALVGGEKGDAVALFADGVGILSSPTAIVATVGTVLGWRP